MFMNSAPHRANILGNFTLVATAWTIASNGYGYVAEEFLNAPAAVPDPFRAMFTIDAFGGVHGDEYEGVLAIPEVMRRLDPAAMRGAVIAVPVCNVPAFATATRSSPIDGLNMARVFPGDPGGALT